MSDLASDLLEDPRAQLPTIYRLKFHGNGGSFFLIFLKNIFLTMITFGIYLAWAKTERRQYVWNNTSFHDQPFLYTGTGMELFKGYMVVSAAYMAFVGIPALLETISPTASEVAVLVMAVGLLFAAPHLIYRSRAFLYNRTIWRSIRFGLIPDSSDYAKTFIKGVIFSFFTLGLYSPVMSNQLYKIMTDNTRFGSLEFHYDGSDRVVFWMGVKAVFFSLLTGGLYYFWYKAKLTRYRMEHTRAGESAMLASEISGGDLFLLYILSTFGVMLTLGLAFPWITMYALRLIAERTRAEGMIDFDAIEQRSRDAGATADGFADMLDLDLGI